MSGRSPFADCPKGTLDDRLPPGAVEPFVVADPVRPGLAAVAWPQDRFRGLVVGVSRDSGRNWSRVVVPGVSRCTGGRFDYVDDVRLSYGPDGVLHLSAHVFDGPGTSPSGLIVARSADGGLTWSRPVEVAVSTDARHGNYVGGAIAVDPRRRGRVYAVVPRITEPTADDEPFRGVTVLARSSDGGRRWSVSEIHDPGPDRLTTAHQIQVLPDGTLVDVFTHVDMTGGGQRVTLAAIRSTDQGRTWSRPVTVAPVHLANVTDPQDAGRPVAYGSALTADVAVDPVTGRLWVVWQDGRFGGETSAIALAGSADGGRTWTAPIKVNATPERIPAPNQQAFTASVEPAGRGAVVVAYSDFRHNDAAASLMTDRWLVRCRPTAAACSQRRETRLTASSFDMTRATLLTDVGPPGYFLGDYNGLAITGDTALALFARPTAGTPGAIFATRTR
ncbi:sialidase family protein [Actinomadura vinacea]|uniref:Sialidase family protein n=1 Tax=Actinomadura vinacea TaxID=115336 RepID=A0ABP5WV95_9ACTN